MKKQTTAEQRPEAWIAVSSSRQKIYGDNEVYLEDGQEFQIELYNPTQSKFLAKIYINGKPMGTTGLVIKPGQRYFLDRFIDQNKKLLFSTYEVDGNSEEVMKAIEKNGMVKVEFYGEVPPYYDWSEISWTNMGGFNSTYTSSWNNCEYWLYSSPIAGSFTTTNDKRTSSYSNNSNPLETGRVEMGSRSDQRFGDDYGSYSVNASYSSFYLIVPRSRKPVEISELRSYCTECGTRIKKKTWKFCPNCGENLD